MAVERVAAALTIRWDPAGARLSCAAPTGLTSSRAAPPASLILALGGADRVRGGDGHDCLVGGTGGDRLRGEDGDDRLTGDSGGDVLSGGPGRNGLRRRFGNDRVEARNGRREVVRCGSGDDTARVDSNDQVRGCETVRKPA